ncbi:hypothetical protein pb186bvf_005206 [Paramecium bursaria]
MNYGFYPYQQNQRKKIDIYFNYFNVILTTFRLFLSQKYIRILKILTNIQIHIKNFLLIGVFDSSILLIFHEIYSFQENLFMYCYFTNFAFSRQQIFISSVKIKIIKNFKQEKTLKISYQDEEFENFITKRLFFVQISYLLRFLNNYDNHMFITIGILFDKHTKSTNYRSETENLAGKQNLDLILSITWIVILFTKRTQLTR